MNDEGWITCPACGGSGAMEHDCFDDSCCCLNPEEEPCDGCGGEGGWFEENA